MTKNEKIRNQTAHSLLKRDALLKTFFLYPFSLDVDDGKLKEEGGWTRSRQTLGDLLKDPEISAEYIYFHPHVRRFLYDVTSSQDADKDLALKHYTLEGFSGFYEIERHDKPKLKACIPKGGLSLYRFHNGVCVLSIEVCASTNKKNPDKNFSVGDMLDFNNLARRLYPSFKRIDLQIDRNELPLSINLEIKSSSGETYKVERRWGLPLGDDSSQMGDPDLVDEIFADPCKMELKKRAFHPFVGAILKPLLGGCRINHLIDDRMLVLSRIGISGSVPSDREDHKVLFSRGMWVDKFTGNLNEKEYNKEFIKKVEEGQSNERWSHYGGEQGFSRYSAFFLGYHDEHEDKIGTEFLRYVETGKFKREGSAQKFLFGNTESMHFKFFLLATFYRFSMLKLSSQVGALKVSQSKPASAAKDIKRVVGDFNLFMNALWFKELTSQEEGIEIFHLMRKAFDLESAFEDLQADFTRTDNYLDSVLALSEIEQNESDRHFNKRLGYFGAFFGMGALATGFFGMNGADLHGVTNIFTLITVLLLFLAYILFALYQNSKHPHRDK
jgi:hypothetical protein